VPVYTYACTACGQEIEKRQSFSDAPLTTCESCGGALRRVLHPVGVIFKGSCFYNTDNRKSGNGSSTNGEADKEKKDSSDSKPAEASTTSKAGESKPASTSSNTPATSAPAAKD
jgi:putative FmdB family regulatory protein